MTREKLSRIAARAEDGTLVALVATLVLVASSQIVLRNLLSITLLWADPLIRHLVLWSGFVGAVVATRESRHIKIDFLFRFCTQRVRHAVQLVTHTCSSLVCLLLFWAAVGFVLDEQAYGQRGFLEIPLWSLQLIFPATFGIMAARFLVQSATCLHMLTESGTD